ncbi:MAG: hypothetical protein U0667_14255 [Chloroflexota bacterium]
MSGRVDAIVAEVKAAPDWATNPSKWVAHFTAIAADIMDPTVRVGGARAGRTEAVRYTHVACALVVAAASPSVKRGGVLDGLVSKLGDGGYS